jgi:hypothetical protein
VGDAKWERLSGRGRVGEVEWERPSAKGRVGGVEGRGHEGETKRGAKWEKLSGRNRVGEAEELFLWLIYCQLVCMD